MKIDLRSVLLGLLLGVVTVFAIGAGEPPNNVGKYQTTGGAGFFVILDTETGQAWFANVASPGLTGVNVGFWEKKGK